MTKTLKTGESNKGVVVARVVRAMRAHKTLSLLSLVFVMVFIGIVVDRVKLVRELDRLSVVQKSSISTEDEAKQLAHEVGVLIDLPSDELPTIATVTDANKLSDKPFFVKAQNGDKVLLYAKNGKAILYRPGVKKVIDVSIVNFTDAEPGATSDLNR